MTNINKIQAYVCNLIGYMYEELSNENIIVIDLLCKKIIQDNGLDETLLKDFELENDKRKISESKFAFIQDLCLNSIRKSDEYFKRHPNMVFDIEDYYIDILASIGDISDEMLEIQI